MNRFIVLTILAVLFWCLFFTALAHADVNMNIIASIESSGNPKAYNKYSEARGLYQITPICLRDYLQYHSEVIQLGDLFNPIINFKVANWYMNTRIPQMLRHYKRKDTLNNRLIAYNCGIASRCYTNTPVETINYINKYERRTK